VHLHWAGFTTFLLRAKLPVVSLEYHHISIEQQYIFGLSLGTHMSNLGFAPAFALFVLLVNWRTALSPVSLVGEGSGFLLGLLAPTFQLPATVGLPDLPSTVG